MFDSTPMIGTIVVHMKSRFQLLDLADGCDLGSGRIPDTRCITVVLVASFGDDFRLSIIFPLFGSMVAVCSEGSLLALRIAVLLVTVYNRSSY